MCGKLKCDIISWNCLPGNYFENQVWRTFSAHLLMPRHVSLRTKVICLKQLEDYVVSRMARSRIISWISCFEPDCFGSFYVPLQLHPRTCLFPQVEGDDLQGFHKHAKLTIQKLFYLKTRNSIFHVESLLLLQILWKPLSCSTLCDDCMTNQFCKQFFTENKSNFNNPF